MTKREYFSLCLDESTDQADEGFTINEELPSLISLHGTTKGTVFFKAVQNCVTGFDKCSCIVRDGAKAMTGTVISFCMLWKHNNINCPIVQQESLQITNIVRGGNKSLNHGKSCNFFSEIDAAYGDLNLQF
ncbi:hypothetical protein T11_14448 [Trichinella zimbabwensis]|uniref:Zinc finger BED domain-containing protein 5 n=1 Tax=Trichinella zimbabwensis TaxID=268475 RepID=A0A0V1I6H4_9BILA|nr:hypothetical protein T11_14448 [Trichinella zimbabwensis]